MPESSAPAFSAVMRMHDYVINVADGTNPFVSRPFMEHVPFYLEPDRPANAGPRSPFFPIPPTFFGPNANPPVSDITYYLPIPPALWPPLTLYEERDYFEDAYGHRILAQRVDSLSPPIPMVSLNLVNTPDAVTLASNDLKVSRIECYIVSEDHRGPTGFEPSDLLEIADDGLGDTGISLWQDTLDETLANGWFNAGDDTQVQLMVVEISETPLPIDMDNIPQDRTGDGQEDVDMWGYHVILQPVDAFNVPIDDLTPGPNSGDELYIVIQTSDTISYKDKIEVVIPHGGVFFQPAGRSAASGTVRHDRDLPAALPVEIGDATPFQDWTRTFAHSQLLANVPTELSALTRTNFDTDGDGVADAQSIGPEKEYEVMAIDMATLNEDAEVYFEYLVVEFYNQGTDTDGNGIPDDEHFSPSVDLMPFTTDSTTSGIALYRDNPANKNGEFNPDDDIPITFDDPPDLVGVSGEPPIQVRMVFSSPGTDDWAGTDSVPVSPYTAHTVPLGNQPQLRQRVPTTFGRNEETGNFISGDPDARADFFVVIRTSDKLGLADDFSVGIVSWGPDTLTGVDPDTYTAPPAPWQPSDEYEKLEHSPWGSRGIGFIELVTAVTPPDPPAYTNRGGFDFLRTRATVRLESDVLYATSGVIVDPIPPPPPPPPPGPGTAAPGALPTLGGGGGGGGCLIATAAFGTRYEEHVVALTAFRDRYLLTNAAGAWLVKRYYSFSPRLAEFVARHDALRAVVRQIVRPVAALAKLCLKTSMAGKIAILFGATLLLAALMRTRRKWRSVRARV
jgi:hypothetical protein